MMIWALLAIFAGGVAITVQAPINARLAAHLGDGMAAAAVSFAVGFVLLAAATAARGQIPSLERLAGLPWWAWTGGTLGVVYVWAAIWSVSALGAVTLVAALILGQMPAALLIDATGAFGLAVREVTPLRLVAVALVGGGVVLSRF
jgi:bacterial/archaeal transporter family-2 protein